MGHLLMSRKERERLVEMKLVKEPGSPPAHYQAEGATSGIISTSISRRYS